ncbi:Aste57867_22488 [Aphanomyces stellatus]|uniref:Aste57867_22488 protein n=1 Tax=Aphanomyces stellatus TaxID=120398 RepID=A0A485LLJ5_9STRA|nr:hypothetical protein As57867_022418 [Aphanomyces stellatus]VFT99148.1 Aste57867_22488 [Aphanomyces stellatus]
MESEVTTPRYSLKLVLTTLCLLAMAGGAVSLVHKSPAISNLISIDASDVTNQLKQSLTAVQSQQQAAETRVQLAADAMASAVDDTYAALTTCLAQAYTTHFVNTTLPIPHDQWPQVMADIQAACSQPPPTATASAAEETLALVLQPRASLSFTKTDVLQFIAAQKDAANETQAAYFDTLWQCTSKALEGFPSGMNLTQVDLTMVASTVGRTCVTSTASPPSTTTTDWATDTVPPAPTVVDSSDDTPTPTFGSALPSDETNAPTTTTAAVESTSPPPMTTTKSEPSATAIPTPLTPSATTDMAWNGVDTGEITTPTTTSGVDDASSTSETAASNPPPTTDAPVNTPASEANVIMTRPPDTIPVVTPLPDGLPATNDPQWPTQSAPTLSALNETISPDTSSVPLTEPTDVPDSTLTPVATIHGRNSTTPPLTTSPVSLNQSTLSIFEFGRCHANASRTIVEDTCLFEPTCSIQAASSIFGPVDCTNKSLAVQAICAATASSATFSMAASRLICPPNMTITSLNPFLPRCLAQPACHVRPEEDDTTTTVVCSFNATFVEATATDNTTLVLACPVGSQITAIRFASFGTPERRVPKHAFAAAVADHLQLLALDNAVQVAKHKYEVLQAQEDLVKACIRQTIDTMDEAKGIRLSRVDEAASRIRTCVTDTP